MPNNEDEWIGEIAMWMHPAHAERAKATIKAKLLEARLPGVDLNDPKYSLQSLDDPIEKFNMFIYKWCPQYAHLIDSDDNDGEYIRQMIAQLQASAPTKKGEDHHGGWRNNEVWLTEEQAEPFRDIEKLL